MATTIDQPPVDEPLGEQNVATSRANGEVPDMITRPPLPIRTISLGTLGSLMILVGAFGAGGILVHDPILGKGPLSWVRYGHGQMLATFTVYFGFALVMWAWIRLGRHVLAGRVGVRPVMIAAACWAAPMLISPPVFTRDVFSYIGQGTLPLYGYDPYKFGPAVLDLREIVQNVHSLWQTTPAPYGPFGILVGKTVVSITGENMIASVIAIRLVLMLGLGLLIWSLPGLVRYLGGNLSVTMWLAIAGPMTVVHLVGGIHHDMMMIGFLAAGCLLTLRGKHVGGIALVTLAMTVKATAGIALPFMVWIWANHLKSTVWRNFIRAGACAVGIFAVVFTAVTFLVFGEFNLGWIEGLQAPGLIVNYVSVPTGVGEIVYALVNIFVDGISKADFVDWARILGFVFIAAFTARQWWLSRHGGPEAVRRAAFSLLIVAMFSPVTLPWYLTWGFVIATALSWGRKQLALVAAVTVFLVLAYDPGGEQLLYKWMPMLAAVAASLLAGASLMKPDPLGLFTDHRELAAAPAPRQSADQAELSDPRSGLVDDDTNDDDTNEDTKDSDDGAQDSAPAGDKPEKSPSQG